jgi:hypothetical protein
MSMDDSPRKTIQNPDARVEQTLASGMIVRQSFKTATRFIFYETGFEGWPFATHGGTLFVVLYRGKPYGLTCRHVFGAFDWQRLMVTAGQHGGGNVGLSQIAYASNPVDHAVDTDILDIAVVLFADDVGAASFTDPAYVVDPKTVTTSKPGDALRIHGVLKTPTAITPDAIAPKFCLMEIVDNTPFSHDPTLRTGFGVFDRPEFSDVVGLSGSPVFNVTQNGLCGMVVRGSMQGNTCVIRYVDMFDICKLLESIHEGHPATSYQRLQTLTVKVPLGSDGGVNTAI